MKSKIKVTGSDARSFLNRMLTNDIEHLKMGSKNYNCLCTNKGKILADLYCEATSQGFVLTSDFSLKDKIIENLKKYIVTDDVTLEIEGVKEGKEHFSEEERIEAGIAKYGIDFDETNIPQEVGLDHALNFEKGCYVGQETIARLHFRGHVNKLLCRFKCEGKEIPERESKIKVADQEAGWVTSASWSQKHKAPLAFGYLKYAYKDESQFWINGKQAVRLHTK